MEILEIRKFPADILRMKCLPVLEISEKERGLLRNMLHSMRRAQGVGLAAPQIGVSQKLMVADIGQGPLFLANPQLLKAKGANKMQEGCLSVPGALVNVKRAQEIVVKGLNEKGRVVELKAKGLLARVLLHEIDHLNGRLILDYMPIWQRIKYKMAKAKK